MAEVGEVAAEIRKESKAVRLKIRQKREIVRRFKTGESRLTIAWDAFNDVNFQESTIYDREDAIEQVLRDYMNGKFTLTHKTRKSKELDYPRRRV